MVGGARGCWGTRLMEPAGWKGAPLRKALGSRGQVSTKPSDGGKGLAA